MIPNSFVIWSKQTDVEEYLGGADADVEATLKSFQDALAYAFSYGKPLSFFQWKKKKLIFILWEAQQVPLHGLKSNSTASEFGGKNSGYQEDSGYDRILAG